ncbi:hypothetical protein AOQ84DRAFT_387817 [Glonium stellatum]|uniref:Uncharacterized protein n=1 Tax=Glonium stellatum TaxID=574774 RepID=A0A8E2F3N5_9PEZI|nr:hypothetical protein AOQ84DRAFT_387817 [Glonium stellatum]
MSVYEDEFPSSSQNLRASKAEKLSIPLSDDDGIQRLQKSDQRAMNSSLNHDVTPLPNKGFKLPNLDNDIGESSQLNALPLGVMALRHHSYYSEVENHDIHTSSNPTVGNISRLSSPSSFTTALSRISTPASFMTAPSPRVAAAVYRSTSFSSMSPAIAPYGTIVNQYLPLNQYPLIQYS